MTCLGVLGNDPEPGPRRIELVSVITEQMMGVRYTLPVDLGSPADAPLPVLIRHMRRGIEGFARSPCGDRGIRLQEVRKRNARRRARHRARALECRHAVAVDETTQIVQHCPVETVERPALFEPTRYRVRCRDIAHVQVRLNHVQHRQGIRRVERGGTVPGRNRIAPLAAGKQVHALEKLLVRDVRRRRGTDVPLGRAWIVRHEHYSHHSLAERLEHRGALRSGRADGRNRPHQRPPRHVRDPGLDAQGVAIEIVGASNDRPRSVPRGRRPEIRFAGADQGEVGRHLHGAALGESLRYPVSRHAAKRREHRIARGILERDDQHALRRRVWRAAEAVPACAGSAHEDEHRDPATPTAREPTALPPNAGACSATEGSLNPMAEPSSVPWVVPSASSA